jgi:hypothetical protein
VAHNIRAIAYSFCGCPCALKSRSQEPGVEANPCVCPPLGEHTASPQNFEALRVRLEKEAHSFHKLEIAKTAKGVGLIIIGETVNRMAAGLQPLA